MSTTYVTLLHSSRCDVPRAWALASSEEELVEQLESFSRTAPILKSFVNTDQPVMVAGSNRFFVSTLH